jgi:hypothetical protein
MPEIHPEIPPGLYFTPARTAEPLPEPVELLRLNHRFHGFRPLAAKGTVDGGHGGASIGEAESQLLFLIDDDGCKTHDGFLLVQYNVFILNPRGSARVGFTEFQKAARQGIYRFCPVSKKVCKFFKGLAKSFQGKGQKGF